ncbi:MAG: hypothetical protein H7329_11615 [Opitutaceae bacterium]|nr:hypothetical protein [Cytophagales bacterium]
MNNYLFKICFLYFAIFGFNHHAFAQLGGIVEAQKLTNKAQDVVDKASEWNTKVQKSAGFALLTEGKKIDVPCALPNPVPHVNVIISKIEINPNGNNADVIVKIDKSVFSASATSDEKIAFVANVPFSRDGGFVGESNLFLYEDVIINIGSSKLKIFAKNPGNGSLSYIKIDCKKFIGMHLSAEFELPETNAENKDGSLSGNLVKAVIETDISDLDNWFFSIEKLPKFQFKFLPDFTWSIKDFVYDNSTSANSAGMVFPSQYIPANESWKGFYCKEGSVTLPKYFKNGDFPDGITLSVAGLLVDDQGVSGNFSAKDIIKDGKIGSWKYSLYSLTLPIEKSAVQNFAMTGVFDTPISEKDGSPFGVSIANNNLQFSVDHLKGFDFKSLGKNTSAKITSTGVNVKVINDEMKVGVNLNQVIITLSPSSSTELLVKVDKLTILSYDPFIEIAGASLDINNESSKFSNFPVTLKSLDFTANNSFMSLGAKLEVKISGSKTADDPLSIVATGSFQIVAQIDPSNDKYKYKDFIPGSFCVEAKNKQYQIKGCIEIFSDEDKGGAPLSGTAAAYGSGFYGYLDAKFIDKIEVKVIAMFGSKAMVVTEPEKRTDYWFLDASVTLPTAIPLFPGVGINGFNGGASMAVSPTTTPCSQGSTGCNMSGLLIAIDDQVGLGIKAGLGIVSIPTPQAFEGTLTLGVTFRKDGGGGVDKITFDGLVKIINLEASGSNAEGLSAAKSDGKADENKVEKADKVDGAAVDWHIVYDFPNATLTGSVGVYINYDGILTGTQDAATHKAGSIDLYFSPNDWYVRVGIPSKMIGVKIVGLVDVESYFYMGSIIPNPAIAPIDGVVNAPVDPTLVNAGMGFGTGVRLHASKKLEIGLPKKGIKVGVGELAVEVTCYANVNVDGSFAAGFDLLLVKDRDPIDCGGNAKDGSRGIKKWYATGQAYLIASIKLGAEAGCGNEGVSLTIASAYINAYVFAQAPNPTYLKGRVDTEFDVLGLVKFPLGFDFEYGEKCDEDIKRFKLSVIDRIVPSNGQLVSAYTGIAVTLKKPLGAILPYSVGPVQVLDLNIINIKYTNKKMPEDADYTDYTSGSLLAKKTSGVTSLFAPETAWTEGKYIATAEVTFSNGSKETENFSFEVFPEPIKIPTNNVAYAYPLPDMKNFFLSASKRGYANFITKPNIPTEIDAASQQFEAKFYSGEKLIATEKVSYNKNPAANQNAFEFDIPTDKMAVSVGYTLKVVKVAIAQYTSDNKQPIVGNTAAGVSKVNDVIVLEYPFTTSRFASFEEKISSLLAGKVTKSGDAYTIALEGKGQAGTEIFDEEFTDFELTGYQPQPGNRIPPLVVIELSESSVSKNYHSPPSYQESNLDPKSPYRTANEFNGKTLTINTAHYIKRAIVHIPCSSCTGNIIDSGVKEVSFKYYLPGRNSEAITQPVPQATVSLSFVVQAE